MFAETWPLIYKWLKKYIYIYLTVVMKYFPEVAINEIDASFSLTPVP